ncbi:cytidylyltransferase domain-containing protein [Lignipirellula cremea]|uniref:3-deoxy-manno-octulosonate cytidylyltransferase n=1 Tax=Lignipirellula cremea TaxID=2528010 RepID=A0A518DN80_9BACT|nr:glycosyltransferase family protein [Lignipirellula cremea]QDU93281.1 3-deoxy-manno-octulosonate cytidylyltransferase [Lignipirellula cremea]
MSVVAIISSKMSSTELLGKSLINLSGEPLLARVLERVQRARSVDQVVVAASTSPADDAIVAYCQSRQWNVFRGAEHDLLERFYRAAHKYRAEVIVRVAPDCPFVDPALVDEAANWVGDGHYDFASNAAMPRTFPQGLEVEAFSFKSFARLRHESELPAWREHVTTGYYRQAEKYRLRRIVHEENLSHMRWTVESLEDLEFAQTVYDYFGHDGFSWTAMLQAIAKRPHWSHINRPARQHAG